MQKLACLCVGFAATMVFADDIVSDVPFVSGFDRFGRHADIDPVTAGRLLITELSCTACHAAHDALLLAKRGPVLDGAGSRLKSDWVRSFLLSPPTSKPGTTMPEMLTGLPPEEREPAADAITAFLSSLQQPFAEIKASGLNPVPMEFWNRGNPENGGRLYHQIGCVACHEPDAEYEVTAVKPSPLDDLLQQLDADELKEMGLSSAARKVNSVPHSSLSVKYTHQSLTYFLLNPEHTRPAGRMPNFSLLAVDAADIAAWLLRSAATANTPPSSTGKSDPALIEHGRKLFNDLHCAACHTIQGVDAAAAARPMATLDPKSKQTCVAVAADADAGVHRTKAQPKWAFDSAQISAVNAAMASVGNAATSDSTAGLSFRLLQQDCYACHERNLLGGIGRHRKPYFETAGHIDIGDEGRLPPALTGVGNRLTTSWITSVLTGKGSVRPFMTIRMPVYPADVTRPLAAMFAIADAGTAKPPNPEKVFAPADPKTLVEAGRQLMDSGCVQCHPFKGEALPGTIGVDLEGVTERVHPNWLHDFLKEPGSLKARTRMPTFFPNGQSQIPDLLNGDVELQISAMHAYLKDLDQQPLPEKIQQARNQNYELTPTDRPVVLRTFMPVTGMHAIAVGFPQHVHFAFDAEQISLTQAWRGRFLDAEGTRFIRFAPPADPLGDKLINFPPGIAVALLADKTSPWPSDAASAGAKFSGYRLDKAGVPTFLYSVHGFPVTDRIEPDDDNGLSRTITISATADSNTGKQLWFRAHVGKSLTQKSPQTVVNETGLAVTVEQAQNPAETRVCTEGAEWIIPVSSGGQTIIKVRYQWE
ncbi:MAG: c-type cytochrome [Planctomycetaceae bacterium]